MSEPVAGDRFDQYELQELLARSGMAYIFKARDTFSGATVALKIPHFQYESDIVFSERFRREEEVGQKLDHPNVVRDPEAARQEPLYLAMEYIEGRSLRAMLGKSAHARRAGAPARPAGRATRWPTWRPTAWSTATSSRRTSWSPPTAR